MTGLTSSNNRVPLAEAAESFAAICNAIDDGDLNETLVALFNETRLTLGAAVDRRICCLQLCSASLSAAKEARDSWRERVKQLEFVEERIKAMTLEAIQLTGMKEIKGDVGRLCMQQNPEALKLDFELFEMPVRNVIEPDMADRLGIPDKYLKKFAALTLDTKALKEDIQNGVEFGWATLSRGAHVRIRV